MPQWAAWVALVLAALVALVTGLSEVRAAAWWIRIWDFPRVQILILAVVILATGWFVAAGQRWLLALLLIPAIGWQAVRIFPYTPLAPTEVRFVAADEVKPGSCFTAMAFNVLQHNRDYARALRLLEREDPDIVLLLETDQAWADALAPFLERYPHRMERPQDNTYGLLFATRLGMTAGEIAELVEPGIPSVFAQLAAEGREFQYIGLHPRPPQPGRDTEERDVEIAVAARRAGEARLPTLAMGDFNDVAWSHTSHLFKRIGEYLDPRLGRGTYPTFPAAWPFIRWPLDHLFISREFAVSDMRVLEHVGSDHLPLIAGLCLDAAVAARANDPAPTPDASDKAEERRILERGRD
jgi:endonuclease/exonuclease/phosphatase (EEP) superfamily protein YafD